MLENPYSNMLGIMKDISINNNSPCICIGKVVAEPPEIQIEYNGILLTKEELWINDYLLVGHSRTKKGHLVSATQNRAGGSGDAEYASHNHDIDNDYTDTDITTDTDLKVGYYVALMPMQASTDKTKQQYIVLCHIKRIDGK